MGSVPSISVSFRVKKNSSGILTIVPQGLLFYSVKPNYKQTVQYLLRKYSEKDHCQYTQISELCNCYAYKMHCSVLAEEAIKKALQDYFDKNHIPYDENTFPDFDHDEHEG